MPWFRVDDGLPHHPKVLSIAKRDRAAALGLWTLAGAWSAANLTDGVVPEYLPEHLGCPRRLADVLVKAGLWSADGRSWRFHAWAERQPSREQVEADRLASKERQQRWRDRVKEKRRSGPVHDEESRRYERGDDDVTNGAVTLPRPDPSLPDPTRPLPSEEEHEKTSSSRGRAARSTATRLPADFAVNAEMQAWALENAPNCGQRDHDQFLDYWIAKPGAAGRKVDWVATWRNWMRKASDERTGRPARSGAVTPTERAAGVAEMAARVAARQQPPPPQLRLIGE